MKHIFIILALVIATANLSAKDVVKNPITNMRLTENLGVYTIRGHSGFIITGNEEQTKRFISSATDAFTQEFLNKTLDIGEDRFTVGKDDGGWYLLKLGLGGVKLRISDVVLFGSALGIKSISEDAKTGFQHAKEKYRKAKKAWRDQ
jgi:hypothetical protein